MGYTHYWYMKKDKKVSNKKWNKLTRDVKLLLDGSPILERAKQRYKALGYLYNDLTITDNEIRYDGGHETFILERKPIRNSWRHTYPNKEEEMVFNFCKTARKEYDGLVTATLLLAKHHLGDEIKIKSDGDEQEWAEGAWGDVPSGYEFVKEILNETDAKAAFTATMADLIQE